MANIPGHTEDSLPEYLNQVSKLIDECERRKDVNEESVITYLTRRITSCKNSLESLKIARTLEIEDIQVSNEGDLDELITAGKNRGKNVTLNCLNFSPAKVDLQRFKFKLPLIGYECRLQT